MRKPWGKSGVECFQSTPVSAGPVRVIDVVIRGVREQGIDLPAVNGIAENCTVEACGTAGIVASRVIDCTVRTAAQTAILTGDNGVVSGSLGESVYEGGINAPGSVVVHSRGIAGGTFAGIEGRAVSHSYGSSVSGTGLEATTAGDPSGVSTTGIGLKATTVDNSSGQSHSGTGLSATAASNSSGISHSGVGLEARTASFCRVYRSSGSGVALNAGIAIGCTTAGGTISSPQKHLGTP